MGSILDCVPAEKETLGINTNTPKEKHNLSASERLASYKSHAALWTVKDEAENETKKIDQVGELYNELKKKNTEHQNVLALCQELQMNNEELKAKVKQKDLDLEDKNVSLTQANEQLKVKSQDAEVYQTQLQEQALQLEQMKLLQEQLAAITAERNQLTDRNRALEQQVINAVTINHRRGALSTDGEGGKSVQSTEDGKSSLNNFDLTTDIGAGAESHSQSSMPDGSSVVSSSENLKNLEAIPPSDYVEEPGSEKLKNLAAIPPSDYVEEPGSENLKSLVAISPREHVEEHLSEFGLD